MDRVGRTLGGASNMGVTPSAPAVEAVSSPTKSSSAAPSASCLFIKRYTPLCHQKVYTRFTERTEIPCSLMGKKPRCRLCVLPFLRNQVEAGICHKADKEPVYAIITIIIRALFQIRADHGLVE